MSEFDIFQNSGYSNKRNRKRTLILDVDDSATADTHLGSGGQFKVDLFEPLVIDKHSEVYLDNFLSFNSNIGQTPATSAFLLKINEFNMNSNVASTHGVTTTTSGVVPGGQNIFNGLIIPNEHKDPSNNHTTVVHKGKKFNYVCDINPQTITRLSGTITDLSGSPIFHGAEIGGRFTYALTGIVTTMTLSNNEEFPLLVSDTITQLIIPGVTLTSNNGVGVCLKERFKTILGNNTKIKE